MQGGNANVEEYPTRLSYGDDSPSQFVLFQWPASAPPSGWHRGRLVFVIHGGFWRGKYGIDPPTAAIETVAPYLAGRGYVVCSIEYRRDNEEYGHGITDMDVIRAVTFVLKRFPSDNVSVIGHSAGGTLALSLLMANVKLFCIRKMILLAPVGDMSRAAELGLSDDGTAVQRYMHHAPLPYDAGCPARAAGDISLSSSSSSSSSGKVELVIVAGGRDTDVPASYVRDFYSTLSRAGHPSCSFLSFENADHYDLANAKSSVWTAGLSSYFPNIPQENA